MDLGVGFVAHFEVWVLVAAVVGLGFYATRVVGPRAVRGAEPITTGSQRAFFAAGVAVLWLASDWPVHDIAEQHLYWVHMVQHLLLTLVMPALFLLSIPTWLARLVIGHGRLRVWVRRLGKPVVAGVAFNAAVVFSHWPAVVNASVASGPAHYAVHLLVVGCAFAMWMPVCGPLPELRMSLPGQMVYLFLMSVIPTVPGAWLTFAEGAVYSAYDIPQRLWGIDVTADQQAAGLIMKLAGGTYLWTIITYLFFTWASRHESATASGNQVTERDVLTWDQVEREFERSPAVSEPPPKV
jgi:putative membrane protein